MTLFMPPEHETERKPSHLSILTACSVGVLGTGAYVSPFPNFSWASSSLAVSDPSRPSSLKTLFPLVSLLLLYFQEAFCDYGLDFVLCGQTLAQVLSTGW